MALYSQDRNLDAASPLDRSKTGLTLLSNAVLTLAIIAACLAALWMVRPPTRDSNRSFSTGTAEPGSSNLGAAWTNFGIRFNSAFASVASLVRGSQGPLSAALRGLGSRPVPFALPAPAGGASIQITGLAELLWSAAARLHSVFPSNDRGGSPPISLDTLLGAVASLGQYNAIVAQTQERLHALPGYVNGALKAVYWVLVLALVWLGVAQLRFLEEGVHRVREAGR